MGRPHRQRLGARTAGAGSGGLFFACVVILIASGYALYYAGSDGFRGLASVVHWGLGLAVPGVFVWHRYLARERTRPATARSIFSVFSSTREK